ncbi:glycolate oxidase subunit GlcF [Marivibrio halodurans]|uniref:Glycolate oxidase iron-sulfur subunit n=1 Tax=Marivibrio halodurans TaxID=2039722 RepID=A0A8J7V0K0_9PROT|nr:glycolate oxidase subunit GlcF [Marivibrio halodurans]MBP5856876.1 glycolate oxidase subunit GlcF [Marivibrio halodurans]
MQTNFTLAQLADPDIEEANKILRNCVHCGFCTATCPTYVLLGDELDSPRGRIYLIKDMLENDKPASEKVVKHIDRCLSCLSCMTTCPSGVHYMHLVDQARERIEKTYVRPLPERMLRRLLSVVLPRPGLFRLALVGAWFAKPFAALAPGRMKAMLGMAPRRIPKVSAVDVPQTFPAEGARKGRVAMLSGCAQQVLAPQINEATVRLLTRGGYDVVVAGGAGCCGALTHHMGDTKDSHRWARANIEAWIAEHERAPLDAVIINASGCGTTVKDYGYMFRTDPDMAEKARTVSTLTKDITEFLAEKGLPPEGDKGVEGRANSLTVAYHSACSMQHGQKITRAPKDLLAAAGFSVVEPAEGHLCCGSAGTYNLMQPAIADRLRTRKVANIERTRPDLVASGNIGCLTQIGGATDLPVVHTVELLDWATGGPRPAGLG